MITKWKIESGLRMPRRGPKRKYSGLPLSEMKAGDSVKVAECYRAQRTPTYISVRKAIEKDSLQYQIRGDFKVTTQSVDDKRCVVRVWRVR
jgi:hypothetical protein